MKLSLKKDLGPLKRVAIEAIDMDAGRARSFYITTVPGQEMVYMEKRREAEAIVAGTTSPGEAPHLAQESELNGVSLFDMAVEILTMADQWATISSAIERLRLGAKNAVNAAAHPNAIDKAQAGFRLAMAAATSAQM